MAESLVVSGLVRVPPPKIMVHKVETRDEKALKQGESNEPLELVVVDPSHPQATVRIGTRMKGEER